MVPLFTWKLFIIDSVRVHSHLRFITPDLLLREMKSQKMDTEPILELLSSCNCSYYHRCLLGRKISRTTADNMHIIHICSDNMQMICTHTDEM